ncbi:helix-turn-helix transcriptional regulator [Ornithinimicrobium panacihumi]|uniref:helix-turn-helix transcriptional regulator n=1 Tax=Ornithinimicrobium panacihumi TaxID=2008449 RepID=UPI003F8CE554
MGEWFSADQLRASRLRAGLTQSELAALLRAKDDRLRVHNQRVSAWEQGRTTPRPYVIRLLAQLLNMPAPAAAQAKDLRDLRTRVGLTVREVAAAVTKTQRTVFRWEKGETLPNAQDRLLLASIFDVDVTEVEKAVALVRESRS